MAFLLCVEFSDYGVVRKVGSSVSGYLIGRYISLKFNLLQIQKLSGNVGSLLVHDFL